MFEPCFLGAISRILKIISYDFPCRYPTPHLGTTRRKQKNNFQRHADQSVQAQAFADKRLPALRGEGGERRRPRSSSCQSRGLVECGEFGSSSSHRRAGAISGEGGRPRGAVKTTQACVWVRIPLPKSCVFLELGRAHASLVWFWWQFLWGLPMNIATKILHASAADHWACASTYDACARRSGEGSINCPAASVAASEIQGASLSDVLARAPTMWPTTFAASSMALGKRCA